MGSVREERGWNQEPKPLTPNTYRTWNALWKPSRHTLRPP